MKESPSAEIRSEDRFRLLIESVKDYAIVMLDTEGRVVSWNPGAERLKGYRAEEILGKHFSIFYTPEDIEARRPQHLLEVAASEGRVEDEGWRLCKGGSRMWTNVVITALRDQDGKLRGFAAVTRDMTERRCAEETMRQLSDRLLKLQDDERRRVARELHDGTAQNLAALTLNLALLSESPQIKRIPRVARTIAACRALADRAFEEIRAISFLMHPPMLDDLGLADALRWYVEGFVERTKIKVDLDLPPNLGKLPSELTTALFRIVQECLTNIHRHSGSRTAEIHLICDSGTLSLQVRDFGKGLGDNTSGPQHRGPANPGVGTLSMRERVRLLGGQFEMESVKPGTLVRATLPIPPEAAASRPSEST